MTQVAWLSRSLACGAREGGGVSWRTAASPTAAPPAPASPALSACGSREPSTDTAAPTVFAVKVSRRK